MRDVEASEFSQLGRMRACDLPAGELLGVCDGHSSSLISAMRACGLLLILASVDSARSVGLQLNFLLILFASESSFVARVLLFLDNFSSIDFLRELLREPSIVLSRAVAKRVEKAGAFISANSFALPNWRSEASPAEILGGLYVTVRARAGVRIVRLG